MKSTDIGGIGLWAFILFCPSVGLRGQDFFSNRWLSVERQLDLKILHSLQQQSDLIIVGQVVKQPFYDNTALHEEHQRTLGPNFNGALSTNSPFTVRVEKILFGNIGTNREITVTVVRDSTQFRYPTNKSLTFFLKKGDFVSGKFYDPLAKPGEWRAVGDYFGILPAEPELEGIIKPLQRSSVSSSEETK
jgi:hypothetical protein